LVGGFVYHQSEQAKLIDHLGELVEVDRWCGIHRKNNQSAIGTLVERTTSYAMLPAPPRRLQARASSRRARRAGIGNHAGSALGDMCEGLDRGLLDAVKRGQRTT
jgi:hypothetical protein